VIQSLIDLFFAD